MTHAQILGRDEVLSRLTTDLFGPRALDECLMARPSDVYATGCIWPQSAQSSPEDDDSLGADGESTHEDGTSADEAVPAKTLHRPSTAGLSFSVRANGDAPSISVLIEFGVYSLVESEKIGDRKRWCRQQHSFLIEDLNLRAGETERPLVKTGVPTGIKLHLRTLMAGQACLLTITLVNSAFPEPARDEIEAATLFQTSVEVFTKPGTQFVKRPSRRSVIDSDDESSALLYRNAHEFAAGHTCSADWRTDAVGNVTSVVTTWLPTAVVPTVNPAGHQLFQELARKSRVFEAAWLAEAGPDELANSLSEFVRIYRAWLSLQTTKLASLPHEFIAAAEANIVRCSDVASRMELAVIRFSVDKTFTRAFQLANQAMLLQYGWDKQRASEGTLKWRPFQLGFLLLAAESSIDSANPARETMDLLWFPTGGGKTEAYLGLIALTAFHRRLTRQDEGAAVVAIMRYTLRLLTTQQFIRASALMMACERIRRISSDLGKTPFSIGLWIGGDASPNKRNESHASLYGREGASPKQLDMCPACGRRLNWTQPSRDEAVQTWCHNKDCELHDAEVPLPIWTVDEDIYEFRPTLLIGTVDKFAQIVRNSEVNHLLGLDDARTPELIIQDELHLISGPLGTVTALYETALDLMLSSRGSKPKIIGSTATIRRAADQVTALFDRALCQFPPPAIDHNDSAFAVTDLNAPGRRYVGVASAGRSAKFTLQAVASSLLQSGNSGFVNLTDADPYWTLVAYFNSLRELGGSLVLMQDDVNDTLKTLSGLRGEKPRISMSIEELTSRRTQEDVRNMLSQLAIPAREPGAVDVLLATNMLSVGVDIPRLGLMLVYGQPKGTAEYIQATSRVGRGKVAGLVVSVLNSAKARDRSHFETFRTWHATLYRDVEATSVTPFASRARDRALHAVLVAMIRHLVPGMLDHPILDRDAELDARKLIDQIVARAARIDSDEALVEQELLDRLEVWLSRSANYYWNDHKPRESLLQSAERAAAEKAAGRSPGEAWPTMNNMRSVETNTPFRLVEGLRSGGGPVT